MAGRGRAPKPLDQRRTRHRPRLGEWRPSPGSGWQHGAIPEPPADLSEQAISTWRSWFQAWYAANWIPADVAMIRIIIRLYDRAELRLARATELSELRLWMDNYGLTPAGRQARRWIEPDAPLAHRPRSNSRYEHLRLVGETNS